MKKSLFMIMAFVLCLVGCNRNNNHEPETFPGYYDYEKVMNEDMMTYRDGVFYESQIIFDTNVMLDSVKVMWIMNVFQKEDTCIQVTHNEKGETEVVMVTEPWLEDLPVDYTDSVGLSLEGALNVLRSSDILLDTKKCTLRRPVYKENYPHAFYIFGDEESGMFYGVESESGEIVEM